MFKIHFAILSLIILTLNSYAQRLNLVDVLNIYNEMDKSPGDAVNIISTQLYSMAQVGVNLKM